MQTQQKAFTLVELIVVITILAILGTIAFMAFGGYSKNARDSVRISDLTTMVKSLNLFETEKGFFPEPSHLFEISYSGSIAWTQGTFGESVLQNVASINEKPEDPLTGDEYAYSITNSKNEFQVATIFEGTNEIARTPTESNTESQITFIPQSYAAESKGTLRVTLQGNYNGQFVKTNSGTTMYILGVPSIITSEIESVDILTILANKTLVYKGYSNLPASYAESGYTMTGGFDFGDTVEPLIYEGTQEDLSDPIDPTARLTLITNLQNLYAGTILETDGNLEELLSTDIDIVTPSDEAKLLAASVVDNTMGTEIVKNEGIALGIMSGGESSPTTLINQTSCASANWIWVPNTLDVYIGVDKGDGFCISPRFGDWNSDSNNGNGGISWNGWGHATNDIINGWYAYNVSDSINSVWTWGQVRRLDSEVSYDCKLLGTASSDYDTTDTIAGRMKWLATAGNSYSEARSIDWITGLVPHTVGTYPHAIPALYIADCIDGVKDLGNTMIYKHINGTTDEVTYDEYNADAVVDTDYPDLTNATYQNRQKYLTAWTQKTGSHLPSAMSYITNGYASASDDDGDMLTGQSRGEYQVACEANLLESNDANAWENIWVSAIGGIEGDAWGSGVRFFGYLNCQRQGSNASGLRGSGRSARFIVRP